MMVPIQVHLHLILFIKIIEASCALVMDQSRQNLDIVPRDLNSDVTELDLTQHILVTSSRSSFDLYRMLTTITLDHCKTKTIEDGTSTFDNQDRLITLNLNYCKIVKLSQTFGTSIQTLINWIMFAGPSYVDIYVYPYFTAFQSLQKLILGRTHFPSFTPAYFRRVWPISDPGCQHWARFPTSAVQGIYVTSRSITMNLPLFLKIILLNYHL